MEIRDYMRSLGKKGGAKGGLRRKETTTPEQRAEWGRLGGKAGGRGRPKKAKARKRGKNA
jgi:hypothetical protein